jgi:mannitol/fructose-specific phosphotransferase system IIA component (Ntr-type)
MNFARFMSDKTIELYWTPDWLEEAVSEEEKPSLRKIQESVAREMAKLLSASGGITNEKKLGTDLFNLEKRSSSAIGMGIAVPHMRSLQTRSLIIGFARLDEPVDFDSPDDEGVNIFIPMVAPPYDDRNYLKLYRFIAKALLETTIKEELLEATHAGQIVRIFNEYFR